MTREMRKTNRLLRDITVEIRLLTAVQAHDHPAEIGPIRKEILRQMAMEDPQQ